MATPTGKGYRVGEDERRGARAALTPVDGDEVDTTVGGFHFVDERDPEVQVADRGLDPDGQSRRVSDHLDPIEHAVDIVELRGAQRACAVDASLDTPYVGDLSRDLDTGKQTTQTGFGALAQLDLDCPNRRRSDDVQQPIEVETTFGIAATEIAGPDLQNQVAALTMVFGQSAFTRVVQHPGHGRTLADRLNGRSSSLLATMY